jgi:hypothetical protein
MSRTRTHHAGDLASPHVGVDIKRRTHWFDAQSPIRAANIQQQTTATGRQDFQAAFEEF